MKIEANPTPEQLKWLLLIALVTMGIGHEELLFMVGI